MDKELFGKIAVVTGAAQGIGAACARVLAREGSTVVIADVREDAARATAEDIGLGCSYCAANVANQEDLQSLHDFVISKYGRIDVLINNAGVSKQVDFLDITEEEFQRVIDINLKGMIFLTQLFMKDMIDKKYGRIVNIASLAGERGGLFAGIHYSTSKAGVIVATKCMALKGGTYGITANAIAPGLIATELAYKLGFDKKTDEIALKRLGTAEEVAEAAAFLASDRASFISGLTVDVNGGQYMR